MNDLIQAPDEAQVPTVVEWANKLTVANHDEYKVALDRLAGIKSLAGRIADFFAPMKKAAADSHKQICAKEKSVLGPLELAEKQAKGVLLAFQRVEDDKRRAEERKLQAEADERARKEREKLQKAAEKLKTPELKQQRLAEAAQVVAPVVAVAAPPKVAGVATRKTWKARVVSPELIPREYLMVDEKKLDRLAKALGGEAKVLGVEFYEEASLAVGKAG
jgi:hypothetical protein